MVLAYQDEYGMVLMNKTDMLQRWMNYCRNLYEQQLDQRTSQEVIKKLKQISPPIICK